MKKSQSFFPNTLLDVPRPENLQAEKPGAKTTYAERVIYAAYVFDTQDFDDTSAGYAVRALRE